MTTIRFIGDWSLYIGVPVALLLGTATWMLYRRESRARRDIYAWLLPAIRTIAVIMLVLMLTGPVLHHRWVVGQLARILVFVDASQSMGVTDKDMTAGRKILAAAQIGLLSDEILPADLLNTRNALAQAAIARLPAQPSQQDITKITTQFSRNIENAYESLQKVKFDNSMLVLVEKGTILYEHWNNFSGSNLGDFARAKGYPDEPTGTEQLKKFQSRSNWNDNYCSKISGYIYPLATGEYTFWVSSDDKSWLFLSTSDDPAAKVQIAKVSSWVTSEKWDQNAEQQSKPITLQAGRRYYIETLHIETTGDDHIAVGWQLPDGAMERPIPGSRLSPFKAATVNQPSLTSKQTALQQFRAELLEPARQLAGDDSKKDPEQTAKKLSELAAKTDFWRKQIRTAIEQWGAKLASSGVDQVSQAINRFDQMTRIERIGELLLHGENPLLARLAESHNIDLLALTGNDIQPLWRSSAGRKLSSTQIPLKLGIEPTATATNLSLAPKTAIGIAQAQTNKKTAKPENISKIAAVMFTDGRHNFGESPLHQAKICGSREIPIFTVATGTMHKPQDIAVLGIEKPLSVFHKDRVKGRIAIKDDIAPGKQFMLRILCDKQTLWEKQLTTIGLGRRIIDYDFAVAEILEQKLAGKERELTFQSLPLNFTAEISGLEQIDCEPGNNAQVFRTRAIFEHNRALILDGRPRWEFRYIRNLFERDEKWDVTTVLADPTAPNGGVQRGDKPTMFPADRNLLYTYDLIIIGDFPSTLLKNEELQWIRDAVSSRGIGLILIDGLRNHLRPYGKTPLAELIPVQWDASEPITNPQSLRLTEKGVLRLTEQGADVAALMLSTGTKTNSEIWESLKPPHWLAQIRTLPGAEVLVEAVLQDKTVPAIVFRRFGAGKVLFTAFDETWRWRYRVADEYHQRYWNQVGNLIMASPFAVSDRYVSIDAGSLIYAPGQNIRIRAKIRDTQGRPVTDAVASADIFLEARKVAEIPLEPDENSGEFRGITAPMLSGNYEVKVRVLGYPEDQMLAKAQFYVQPPEAGELTQLDCDEQILRQIASNASGDFFHEENASELSSRLKLLSEGRVMQSDTALWQGYLWFAVIVLLITIEWILRKRVGML
ncbi:MAG: hypothetical protein JW720_03390 [Sedimentisphaerales bacterium]|nr:hypothetical protein [Sedimentisphaerales bacterium]